MKKANYVFLTLLLLSLLNSCTTKKAELLQKEWKATELKLGETVLNADDVGGVYFSFKPDSSFIYTETGSAQSGSWSLSEDGKTIDLTYQEGARKVTQTIQELTAEKLVLNYEEHGMQRSISLVPVLTK
jgi:hypothetical protein